MRPNLNEREQVMSWSLAGSLVTLRAQINAAWPNRNKRSDGTIGDQAHAARRSDHNPNAAGVVTAADFTHDPASGADMSLLAEELRASQDRRIKYVIFNRRLFSSYRTAARAPWTWGTYTGSNPHTSHLHISVSADLSLYDNLAAWQIGDDMSQFTDAEARFLREMAAEAIRMGSDGRNFAHWLLRLFRNVRDTFTDR